MRLRAIIFPIFLLCLGFSAKTGAQCLVSSIYVNTAFNPATYSAIASGTASSPALDPHWIVMSASTSTTGAAAPGSPVYIIPPAGPWVANPNTNPGGWISVINVLGYTTYGDTIRYYMTMGRPFRTCKDDSITFDLHIANDNWMDVLAIDGTPLSFSQAAPGTAACFTGYSTFTQTVFLPAGNHVLTALVNNYNQAGYNPTGMDIYGTVSSRRNLPSIVYDADTNCNRYVCGTPVATCGTFTLPDSIDGCLGSTVTMTGSLSAPDSLVKVRWSPTTGVSDTTILNPFITVTPPSRYYRVAVNSVIPANLVVNGNFDFSNSGFTNDYLWMPTTTSAAHFGVGSNPITYFSSWPSMGDHTTGTGKMLIVDGHTSAGKAFWKADIPVTPGNSYDLSFWIALLHATAPPTVSVTINGASAGATFTPTTVGSWVPVQYTWNSGSDTVAHIVMTDLVVGTTGNDLAMDDVTFRTRCTHYDSIFVKAVTPDTVHTLVKVDACDSAGAITLTAPRTGYTSYLWNTGSTATTISTTLSGVYYVASTLGCHVALDSIDLTVIPYNVTLSIVDTAFCFPGKYSLVAANGYSGYLWQDGTAGPTYPVSATGAYWSVSHGRCAKHTDSFNVSHKDLTLSLGPDTTVCMNYLIEPSVKDTNAKFLWQDGATSPNYSASHTGTYTATVSLGGCTATDAIDVRFFHWEHDIPDTFICKGEKFAIPLTVTPPQGGTVLWENGSTSTSRVVSDSGIYWVYIKKNECEILDTIRVNTGYCDCWHNVPSAFTPNADGLNDIAKPAIQPGCPVGGYQFSIFNRWGELVFSSDFPGKGWDGTYKGVPADLGVYYYSLQFFVGVNQRAVRSNGNITLVR